MGEGTPGGKCAYPAPIVIWWGWGNIHRPSDLDDCQAFSGQTSTNLWTHVKIQRVIPASRSRRSPVDRFDERRNELAESALLTLGELGYARTSLRDIASNSPFSHGVLHYYFADKLELVILQHHLLQDALRAPATTRWSSSRPPRRSCSTGSRPSWSRRSSTRRRCTGSGTTCASRACSTSGSARPCSGSTAALQDMIWRIVTRYSELADREVAMDPASAYGVLDGLFQAALLGHVTGNPAALPTLVTQVHSADAADARARCREKWTPSAERLRSSAGTRGCRP